MSTALAAATGWRDAACRNLPADKLQLWWPNSGEYAEWARQKCRQCPRLVECRELAIAEQVPFGLWGDTTPKERARIIRCRNGQCRHPQHWAGERW